MRSSGVVCGLAAVVLLVAMPAYSATAPAPRGGKIALKLSLKPGDQRKMILDMDMKAIVSVGGEKQQMDMSTETAGMGDLGSEGGASFQALAVGVHCSATGLWRAGGGHGP